MAGDCNCTNPSCPCYRGNETKAEQPATGPDAPSQDSASPRIESANPSINGTHGGSAMTAPSASSAEAGVTIGALERAYTAELASATSFMDQMTAIATDRAQAAANFDSVVGQLTSAKHDGATVNEAAAVSEALATVAQQCGQTKEGSDVVVAALKAALGVEGSEGIKRHNLAREYAGSVQSGASMDNFRE